MLLVKIPTGYCVNFTFLPRTRHAIAVSFATPCNSTSSSLSYYSATVGSVFSESADKETVALINRVESRVAGGDTKALDELTSLPGKWSTPVLLTIFKQNYNVYGATPSNKAIGARAAQLATTTPGGEEYLRKLLKGKPENNNVYFQQESAIKCLALVHSDISVRILCGALDDVDKDEIGLKLTRALTMLNLPGAPISPKDKVSEGDALAKWKKWWEVHKDNYPAK